MNQYKRIPCPSPDCDNGSVQISVELLLKGKLFACDTCGCKTGLAPENQHVFLHEYFLHHETSNRGMTNGY